MESGNLRTAGVNALQSRAFTQEINVSNCCVIIKLKLKTKKCPQLLIHLICCLFTDAVSVQIT
jgi:hypothetical protein